MRPGITKVELSRAEARAFRRRCELEGARVVHECPTTNGKTVFLYEGTLKTPDKALPAKP